jgi:hypothetical protein
VYQERQKKILDGVPPEEARLTKDEVKDLCNLKHGLKLTNPELDQIYNEQFMDEKKLKFEEEEMRLQADNEGLKHEPLTRAEIEKIAKEKGIKLSEEDI